MPVAALILALQAAAASDPLAHAPGERFSILVDPCAGSGGGDVVVCGRPDAIAPRLPLPDERTPDGPVPSNPYLRASPDGPAAPCAATLEGCTVGFGPPVIPTVLAAVRLARGAAKQRADARRRERDGDRRVPIPLEDAPVDVAGKMLP